MDTLFKQPRLRRRNGQFCTKKEYLFEKYKSDAERYRLIAEVERRKAEALSKAYSDLQRIYNELKKTSEEMLEKLKTFVFK
jgi:hypothetical protein